MMKSEKRKAQSVKLKFKIKKFLVLGLGFTFYALCLTLCSAFAEPLSYKLSARFLPDKHWVEVNEEVTFTNPQDFPVADLCFHVYPNRRYTDEEKAFITRYAGYFKIDPYPEGLPCGGVIINFVRQDRDLPYVFEGEDATILRVKLPRPLQPGEKATITINFSLSIPHAYGRYGWYNEGKNAQIFSLVRWYPMLSVLEKDGWRNYPYYPYHQPYYSESAQYYMELELPAEYTVAHTGKLREAAATSAQSKKIIIETEKPVRDFGLVLSKDLSVLEREYRGIAIKVLYLKGDDSQAEEAFQSCSRLINFYTRLFGDYPYSTFAIAPSYLGYGGTESSNLILLDTRVFKLPGFLSRYFDFLVSHETGHQWFYNVLGSDEYRQMWLDEGFNSYFVLQYLEEVYGPGAEVMKLPVWVSYLLPNFTFLRSQGDRYLQTTKYGLDHAVLGELSSFQEPSNIFSITYSKGAGVVSMLRELLGEDVFWKVMRRCFSEFRFRNINVEALQRICEEESGKNLDWFFADWLKEVKFCDYRIQAIQGNQVVVENKGNTASPTTLAVKLSDGRVLTKELPVDKEAFRVPGKSHIDFPEGTKIQEASIDPEGKGLDIDRVNNTYPRRLRLIGVPLYYLVYDIPLFLPNDSYNLVAGPDIGDGGLGFKASLQRPYDWISYVTSHFDLGENKLNSRIGFRLNHIGQRELSTGIEWFDFDELGGDDDQRGFKVDLTQELWPVSYGLDQINDHVSLYLLRDRRLIGSLLPQQEEREEPYWYRQNHEAVVGLSLHLNRSGPYPDPHTGWQFSSRVESAGHFMGGEVAYQRFNLDFTRYLDLCKILPGHKLAGRCNTGWGWPQELGLFQIGGSKGLRGYESKALAGSRFIMGSFEYRFPIVGGMHLYFLDKLFCLSGIEGALFFDAGKAWARDFSRNNFKKDAGLGLCFIFGIAGPLEKVVVRLDLAQAIHDPKHDKRLWLGVSHTF